MSWQGEPLFTHFGVRLLKAILWVLFEQINVLRVKAGLATITWQQAVDAVQAKYDALAPDDEGSDR